ncbi:MAG: tRNA 2-thiouridine(34) synthase MnmA [Proteobacteria bacterium]|nr:MAG: tRNA 2-thiouridine(34) synthase MnmA [Pseudomonadota bacterium]PIE20043.1 MAG: tRNA 2-thiouridine(34) synthase MnmA [Pseudomonadota bacterium]
MTMGGRERVVVALSGGVDSSVAAATLCEAGYEVVGVTLQLQDCDDAKSSPSCCGLDGISRARAVAGQLGIRHYLLERVEAFSERVLAPTWEAYAAGRTPSPCLLCNQEIKLGTLLDWAEELGAERVATGHYARIERDGSGAPRLLRGLDRNKDQSYFLAGLHRDQLERLLLPLGGLHKDVVRERARALGLANAETHDSQDACLVAPGQRFAEILRRRFDAPARRGRVVDEDGKPLADHEGIHHFTVGQRKGLGLQTLRKHWVKAVSDDGSVVVTPKPDRLLERELSATNVSWLGEAGPPAGVSLRARVQIRYRHRAQLATLEQPTPGVVHATFDEPARAISPGQAAVFYEAERGERVLGQGWIARREQANATPGSARP